MLMLASAAGSSLTYLQSLLQQGSATSGTATTNPLDALLASLGSSTQASTTTGTGGTAPSTTGANGPSLSPDMMAALISFQSQSSDPSQSSPASQLFSKLDADGNGTISKTEFENAFGANADTSKVDALFSKLDTNGDGSVSQDELDQAQKQGGGHHRHHHHVGGGGGGGGGSGSSGATDSLTATDATGATTQAVTNADGSTTTTITYADGSKVATTSAVPTTSGDSTSPGAGNQKSANFLEQLIKLQAQALSAAAAVTMPTV